MNSANPLESIFYINLPEDYKLPDNAFKIDITIPLPVQSPVKNPKDFDTSSLTWEMILAGILTVLAYDKNNQHIHYYRSLITTVKPNIKTELTQAAILKVKNEDFDIAEEIFTALHGLDPEDMRTILNLALFFDERAESYRKSGLIEDADAYDDCAHNYYQQAMVAEPAVPDAFFNAGFFYLKQKNYTKAKNCFETYLSLSEKYEEDQITESDNKKRKRAEEIIQDINSRNLEDELFKSAYDFIVMGQEEKGLESIKEFLETNPKVWNAWFMLGWALRRLERWSDAKLAFIKAIELGGDNTDTYNELAICCIELEDYSECKKYLSEALRIEPENTKIISNLGFLELKQGNISEAQKYFTIVLELDPNDVIAKKTLENLEI
jgi:tetratricopeptide (TPR) repeat protein